MSKKTILFAGMVGALVLGLAGSVGAGFDPTMTVSPTSGQPGSTFTVSGTQCFFESTGDDVGADGVLGPEVTVQVAFPTPVNGSTNADLELGTWSIQFTVPAGTPPGTYPVTATCHNTPETKSAGDVSTQDFNYPPGSTFTVNAPPPAPVVPPPVVGGSATPAPAPAPAPPVGAAPQLAG